MPSPLVTCVEVAVRCRFCGDRNPWPVPVPGWDDNCKKEPVEPAERKAA